MSGEIIIAIYLVLVMLNVLSSLKRLAHILITALELHPISQMKKLRHGGVE